MTRDAAAAVLTALAFSFSLAIAQVTLPLLGLAAGYGPAELGLFFAAGSLAQLVVRTLLVAAMRLCADRTLIAVAIALMALSVLVVIVSPAQPVFVIGQLLQGVARGCYWTASQTHVVRTQRHAVKAISALNLASSAAAVLGPLLAGFLAERDLTWALWAAALIAVTALPLVALLERLPKLGPSLDPTAGRLWRRPGVSNACWASATAGGWVAMLGSYVPIVLESAHQSPAVVGGLVSLANVAVLVGAGLLVRVGPVASRTGMTLAIVVTGAGTAAVGLAAHQPVLAGLALALSGLGAGILQTLGPAMATGAVRVDQRERAIVATGTFRAGALFLSPLGVAGGLALLGLTAAAGLAVMGAVIALPALAARRPMR